MSSKSNDTGFEDVLIMILGLAIVFAAIVLALMLAVWILGLALMVVVLFILPLVLPALVGGVLLGALASSSEAATLNEYELKINAVTPVVGYAVVACIFILAIGIPEKHRVRFDEKTNARWAEIQWPALVEKIASAKNTLKIGQDDKSEFRVSDLNENGDYFIPKLKKTRVKQKTKQQKLIDGYGPLPPTGYVLPEDFEKEPAQQILELKLMGLHGNDGIPYDLSFLQWLLAISFFVGAPGVFMYLMHGYLVEERARALKKAEEFTQLEKDKRDSLSNTIEAEKYNSKRALQRKDEEIKILNDRIAEMAKMHLELTETLIPGSAVRASAKVATGEQREFKSDKPKGALGSDFL